MGKYCKSLAPKILYKICSSNKGLTNWSFKSHIVWLVGTQFFFSFACDVVKPEKAFALVL